MYRTLGVAVAIAAVAAPAAAQFSPGYNFLKAVKDRDFSKAKPLIDAAGSNVVNTKDGDTGLYPLHMVTKDGDAQWIIFLLQSGAQPDVRDNDGNTPLMLATLVRSVESVKILLLVHAQTNATNRLAETPLIVATRNRDAVIAKMLLEANANPDLTDNTGASARSLATADPRGAAIARLLKDVPVRSKNPAVQGPH